MTGLDNSNVLQRRLVVCIVLLLATTLAMNLLSALIRHQEAGLGCADWPVCYAVVDRSVAPASAVDAAAYALTPTATFKRAHRVIATLLVALVLAIVYLTRQLPPAPGFARFLPQLLVAVVLLLALIGPASYRKALPAVATINLLGGMALLALGYWLWRVVRAVPRRDGPVRLAGWALGIVIVQVVLGGWTSANFAGIACTGLTQCPGAQLAGAGMSGFLFWRELALDDGGRVIMDNSQLFIQGAHRIVALLCAATVGALGVALWRYGGACAKHGMVLLGLLTLQIGLGIAGATQALPLVLVLAHNLVASLLLVMVLRAVLSSRAT